MLTPVAAAITCWYTPAVRFVDAISLLFQRHYFLLDECRLIYAIFIHVDCHFTLRFMAYFSALRWDYFLVSSVATVIAAEFFAGISLLPRISFVIFRRLIREFDISLMFSHTQVTLFAYYALLCHYQLFRWTLIMPPMTRLPPFSFRSCQPFRFACRHIFSLRFAFASMARFAAATLLHAFAAVIVSRRAIDSRRLPDITLMLTLDAVTPPYLIFAAAIADCWYAPYYFDMLPCHEAR